MTFYRNLADYTYIRGNAAVQKDVIAIRKQLSELDSLSIAFHDEEIVFYGMKDTEKIIVKFIASDTDNFVSLSINDNGFECNITIDMLSKLINN
jgi:hypothetical protein